jgi:hypothetical protein
LIIHVENSVKDFNFNFSFVKFGFHSYKVISLFNKIIKLKKMF